jgi:hypothetical protein
MKLSVLSHFDFSVEFFLSSTLFDVGWTVWIRSDLLISEKILLKFPRLQHNRSANQLENAQQSNAMDRNTLSKADQEILQILLNPKVDYQVHT